MADDARIPTWDEISGSDLFRSMPSADREQVRLDFFNDFVAPNVPGDALDDVRASFDQDTSPAALGLTSLDDFKKANPYFAQVPDAALFDHIRQKYYPDADKNTLAIALGYDDGSKATAGDYGRALMAGTAGLVEAAGKGVSMLPGETATEVGRKIQDVGKESADYWQDTMTPAGKRAMSNEIITDDFKLGKTPLQSAFLQVAISAPSMAAMLPVGGPIASGIAKIGGKALLTLAKHPGVVGFIARHLPTAIGFGTAEGGIAALQNASQTEYDARERLRADDKLRAESPTFQKFYSETDPALPQSRREELAIDATAKVAADDVALKTLFSTGGIGIATGGGAMGMYARLASTFGKKAAQEAVKQGFIKTVAKGIGEEALQETPQSGMEAYIQNKARQKHIEPGADPTKGVVSQALGGGIVGGITGGVVGGAGYFAQPGERELPKPETKPIRRTDADVVTDITQAPTVDAAIAATEAAVSTPTAPPAAPIAPSTDLPPVAHPVVPPAATPPAVSATDLGGLINRNLAVEQKTPMQAAFSKALEHAKQDVPRETPRQAVPPPVVPTLAPEKPIVAPAAPPAPPTQLDTQNRNRELLASIKQMQDIAARPDYLRLGPSRAPETGAPLAFANADQSNIPTELLGKEDVAVLSDGRRIPFRYAVVEADTVQPSNLADGSVNPAYSSTEPGVIRALSNGRAAGVRSAYERGTAAPYVEALVADTEAHGISPQAIQGLKRPVLIRLYNESANTADIGAKSQGGTLGLSATEQAIGDAKLLTEDVLALHKPGDITSTANRDFVQAFVGKVGDLSSIFGPDKQLSQAGRRRIEAALMVAAYGNTNIVSELFESTDTDIKAIGDALREVAGIWAGMREAAKKGYIDPQTDITSHLMEAVQIVRKARAEGKSVVDLAGQGDLIGGTFIHPLTEYFLRLFYRGRTFDRARSKADVVLGLTTYTESANATKAEAGLFGEAGRVRPEEILQSTLRKLDEQDIAPAQTSIALGREPGREVPDGRREAIEGHIGPSRGREAPEQVRAEKEEVAPPEAPAKPAYGDDNRIFKKEDADRAREILRRKLDQINAGIDPELMQAAVTLAGYHVESGARKFKDFSTKMVADLGEAIKPYLKALYLSVRNWPRFDSKGMQTEAEIDAEAKSPQADMFGGKDETKQAVADRENVAKPVRQVLVPVSKRGNYYVEFEGQRYSVDSFKDASEKWDKFRETTNAGASQIGGGVKIFDQNGNEVARIAYNGRVFPPGEWKSGVKPLYEPAGRTFSHPSNEIESGTARPTEQAETAISIPEKPIQAPAPVAESQKPPVEQKPEALPALAEYVAQNKITASRSGKDWRILSNGDRIDIVSSRSWLARDLDITAGSELGAIRLHHATKAFNALISGEAVSPAVLTSYPKLQDVVKKNQEDRARVDERNANEAKTRDSFEAAIANGEQPLTGVRAKYPDGRLIPIAGEKVYQMVQGPFGMPAVINGEVFNKGKYLFVRITGSSSLIGQGPQIGKNYSLKPAWTVVDDPELKRRDEAKAAKSAAEDKARADEKISNEAKTRASFEDAIAKGEQPLTSDNAKVGMEITSHNWTAPGEKWAITEIDEKGRVYGRPVSEADEGGGYLGRDIEKRFTVPIAGEVTSKSQPEAAATKTDDLFAQPANTLSAADLLRAAASKMEEAAKPVEKPAAKAEVGQGGKAEVNTEDSGQELTANKRNRVARLSWDDIKDKDAALRIRETTKNKVYPKPDYQAMIDDGMQPLIAHIVKQTYDALAAKPNTSAAPTDVQLEAYIVGVNRYMDGVMAWANDKNKVGAFIQKLAGKARVLRGANAGVPTSLSSLDYVGERSMLETVYPDGWKNSQEEVRLIGGNKPLRALQPSTDEAMRAMKEIDKGWPSAQEAWQRQGYSVVVGDDVTASVYAGSRTDGTKYASISYRIGTQTIKTDFVEGAASEADDAVQNEIKAGLAEIKGRFLLLGKNRRSVGAFDTEEAAKDKARELTKRGKKDTISDKGISVEAAERTGSDRRSILTQDTIDRAELDAKRASNFFVTQPLSPELPTILRVPLAPASFGRSDFVDAKGDESFSYVARVNAEFLSNLSKVGTLDVERLRGLDIPTLRLVLSSVVASVHDQQVRGRIVELIPVDVVNDLAAADFSPYKLLSDPSVLSDALSTDQNPSVAVPDFDLVLRFISSVAGVIAKDISSGAAWTLPNVGTTESTGALDESEGADSLKFGRFSGQDISSDDLRHTFSFKAVNFGNWMKGKSNTEERQLHLNHAYDAFMDLAEMLGVPPKAMSLNGMLGIAIGAQGTGQYAAHFVAGVNEINLTRTSGAGSLAHEFAHAVDHYFARLGGLERKPDPWLTNHTHADSLKSLSGDLRPEMLAGFKAIVQAMNSRPQSESERTQQREFSIKRAEKNVNGWLDAIRRNFIREKVDEKAFDALADRVRNLDLGDGMVAVSGKTSLHQTIAELRDLYKTTTGRLYGLDQMVGMQNNVDHMKYLKDSKLESSDHIAQVQSDYSREAAKIDKDKGGKPYWNTPWEKFARAFDAYVSDKLEAKAAKNTYLSHAGRDNETVPKGEERKAINAAFDKLIGELKTKETGKDVAMYSRRPDSKRFFTTCVNCPGSDPGEAILDMVDQAKDISRDTFLRRVHSDDMQDLERALGYSVGNERGLHMKDDYHVSYHKSMFRGHQVVYFVQSAIEHIFIDPSADRAVLSDVRLDDTMYSRRLYREHEGAETKEDSFDAQDYIVPETPEYDGNETGDLAYTPRSAEAKGIEQLPIRLTVGVAYSQHRGFGMMHMAQEGDTNIRRRAPAVTNDEAENYARHIAAIAKTFDEIYAEGSRVIMRSNRIHDAIVTQRVVDEETGAPYYSIVTVVPSRTPVWGNPVWRAGRADFPTDRTLKPGAPEPSPGRASQQPDRQTLGEVQTEHFDLSKERDRLQAKRQPVAGKDIPVTAKKRRRVVRAKDDPQFSRGPRQIGSDDTLVSAALSILASSDELFRFPVSDAKDMSGIVADVDPKIRVTEHGRANARAYNVDAVRAWTLSLPDSSGKNQTASVIELPGDKLYLNVSEFKEGGAGNTIYHIVANFAHNNDMVFVGDPYGLSNAAMYRRTENMLASALKFGTTRHLAPHERQLEGDKDLGIMPLDWAPGEDARNINSLAEVAFSSVVRRVPEMANIVYNFETHRFEDADGNEFSDKRFVELATRPGARTARAGRDTLKRTALVNSLLQTGRGAERGRVLGELLRQSREHLDPALQQIFYSRDRATSGLPVSALRTHLSRAINALTVPVRVYEDAAAARLDGFTLPDDAKGVNQNNRIGLIAANIPDLRTAEETLWHEVQHAGIRALNKSSDAYDTYRGYQSTLTKVAMANPHVRERAAEWRAKYGQEKTEQFRALGLEGAALEEAVRIASWDEAVAELAGKLGGKPIKFLHELVAALQRLLRALGFENLANWMEGKTDAEVLVLIRRSMAAVMSDATSGGMPGADAPAYSNTAPIYYSALLAAIESIQQPKATADQWKGIIKNLPGVKAEEVDWLGVDEWLDEQKGPVTKSALLDFIRANQVEVRDVTLGQRDGDIEWDGNELILKGETVAFISPGKDGGWDVYDSYVGKVEEGWLGYSTSKNEAKITAERFARQGNANFSESDQTTKFASYQLPGGENYRELLLTLPTEKRPIPSSEMDLSKPDAEQQLEAQQQSNVGLFRSSHFDEPNVLAHVRFNERTDADGKRVLFIEEVQSDWHQKGRKEGYSGIAVKYQPFTRNGNPLESPFSNREEAQRLADDVPGATVREVNIATDGIPDAPFKTTWPLLAMKRMIRWGVENGSPGNAAWLDVAKPESAREQVEQHFGSELASMIPLKVMDVPVLLALKNDKILRAVVEAVPVNVVNIIADNGITPESLLREGDMFGKSVPVPVRAAVARGLASALHLVGTRLRTALDGVLSSETGRGDKEVLPAVRASQLDPRVVMGLLSPTTLYQAPAGSLAVEQSAAGRGAEATEAAIDDARVRGELPAAKLALFLNRHDAIVTGSTSNSTQKYQAPAPFEKIAWATGTQQADRYDLSKQVDSIDTRMVGGEYQVSLRKNGSPLGTIQRYTKEMLPGAVGKDLSEKIVSYHVGAKADSSKEWRGLDLKIGGEGMRQFYDVMLPSMVNKYVKKWGGKVGRAVIPETIVERSGMGGWIIHSKTKGVQEVGAGYGDTELDVLKSWYGGRIPEDILSHAIDITPAMRSAAMQGQPMFARRDQIDTPEFRAWFGDSKVVDAEGKPLVVYHGTDKKFTVFNPKKSRQDYGMFFTSDEEVAGLFAGDEDTRIMPLYLKIENPFVVDFKGQEYPYEDGYSDIIKKAEANGHDGVIIKNIADSPYYDGDQVHGVISDQYVVFRPEQIKSAIGNRGTFDPNDGNIMYSRDADEPDMGRRGFIRMAGAGIASWAGISAEAARTPVQPNLRSLMLSGNAKGAMAWIAANGSNAHYRELARTLDTLIPYDRVRLIFGYTGASGTAEVHRGDGRITVTLSDNYSTENSGITETTFLHEFLHAAILARYDVLNYYVPNKERLKFGDRHADEAIKTYIKVWREFRSEAASDAKKDDAPIWLTQPYNNPDEFITYAMTSDKFRAWLRSKTYGGETLWNRLKNAIARILGFKEVPSWLDAAMAASNDVLDAAKHDRPDFAVSRKLHSALGERDATQKHAIADAVTDRAKKTSDYLIYNYQDKFIDLKRIQKRAGDVPEDVDAYLAQERYPGQVAARVKDFHDDLLDPLIKAMHDAGLSYDEVEQYLHARHAPSRNAAMRQINPTEAQLEARKAEVAAERDRLRDTTDVKQYIDLRRRMRSAEADIEDGIADESLRRVLEDDMRAMMRDSQDVRDYTRAVETLKGLERIEPYQGDNTALSGMSDEKAAEIIEAARRSGRQGALDRVAGMVDEITTKTREVIVDAGLEKPETIAAWEAKYEHYVPLHRDEVGEFGMPALGQGYNVRGPESKRATGSTKDVTDILAHVAAQHEAAIIRAEKVKVDRALYDFARANPDESLWTLDTADKQSVVDPVTGTVTSRVNPLYKLRPNVLTFKLDGEERTITFNEQNPEAMRLAVSMKNLAAHDLGEVTKLIGRFTRFLATMNTSANPVFVARNFMRDLSTAFINLSDTELADMKKDVYRDIPKAIRGFWQMARGDTNTEWGRYAREFRDAGGQTGWLDHYKDIGERAGNLRKQLAAMDKGAVNFTKQEALKFWSLIEDANLAVENGVRLAAYVNARKAGLSDGKAASLAKNLTVNFNRHGAKGVELNMWYMFMNASIQGTARVIKALGNKNVQKIIGYVIASSFLMDILARALAGDGDDDGENDYDQLAEHIKAMNFVFWVNGRAVTIPMPYGYNFFASVGRKMSESIFRKNYSPLRSAADIVNIAFDAFSPTGQSGSMLQFVAPTIADPFVQWAENKAFHGGPLRREQLPFGPPKPEYQMGFKSTSAPAKWLAETLNDLTGGNEVRPGFINMNPAMFDFAVTSLAGGAGRTYLQVFNLPIKTVAGDEIQPREVPFVNIFSGAKPEYQTERKFYENIREVERARDELKHYRSDSAMTREIRERSGAEIRLAGRAKFTLASLESLRKQERRVEKSRSPDSRKRLTDISERRRALMARFNKAYTDAHQ